MDQEFEYVRRGASSKHSRIPQTTPFRSFWFGIGEVPLPIIVDDARLAKTYTSRRDCARIAAAAAAVAAASSWNL